MSLKGLELILQGDRPWLLLGHPGVTAKEVANGEKSGVKIKLWNIQTEAEKAEHSVVDRDFNEECYLYNYFNGIDGYRKVLKKMFNALLKHELEKFRRYMAKNPKKTRKT